MAALSVTGAWYWWAVGGLGVLIAGIAMLALAVY